MSKRPTRVDATRFGPWALVTGASSGIGHAFAGQLAANGINLVLAARRLSILDTIGQELAGRHGIRYRPVQVDLAEPDHLDTIVAATGDLDIGLVVSNAGDMNLGEFVATPYRDLVTELRVNAESHLGLSHHFGRSLIERGRGGVILLSSVAGVQGVPWIANYSATKAYVLALGEALHRELSPHGVTVTVLVPGATATPMTARFGADRTAMGRLMMPAWDCAAEGLAALSARRATRISGRMNRVMVALTPRATRVRMFGGMNRSMAVRTGAPAYGATG
jgi:short-subunit dehydrogenase